MSFVEMFTVENDSGRRRSGGVGAFNRCWARRGDSGRDVVPVAAGKYWTGNGGEA